MGLGSRLLVPSPSIEREPAGDAGTLQGGPENRCGGKAATCLHRALGMLVPLPLLLQVSPPVTPPLCIHLGHFEGLWSGHRAAWL